MNSEDEKPSLTPGQTVRVRGKRYSTHMTVLEVALAFGRWLVKVQAEGMRGPIYLLADDVELVPEDEDDDLPF